MGRHHALPYAFGFCTASSIPSGLLGAAHEATVQHSRAIVSDPNKALSNNEERVARCRQALAITPNDPRLHCNLGNALLHAGCTEEAIAAYQQAIATDPRYAEAYNNLAAASQTLGRFEEAASHYRTALAINPDNAVAHNNLGNALQAQKRTEHALDHYRRALAIRPDYPEVHNNAGVALISLKRLEQAVAHLGQAIQARPNYAEAHNNMAVALTKLGRLEEALTHSEKANAISPGRSEVHLSLGNILQELERSEEAIAHFEAAIAADPSCAEARNNLATALCDVGRFDEARAAIASAIEIEPANTKFYLTLTQCRRMTADDPNLAAMEALASDTASLTVDARISLHFALGRAFADAEQFDRSFDHLLRGNALKRSQTGYDEAQILGFIDRLGHVFTPELMRTKRGHGDPSSLPIFIIGMPRSGTTLVEQMLASHPLVFGAGERSAFVMGLTDHEGRKVTPLDFFGIVQTMSGGQLRELGAAYIAEISRGAPCVARITDKLNSNYLFAGLIHLALPNARIIHMRRDPLDTCVSCFSLLFRSGQAYSYDLGELGRYFRGYERLMAHWRRVLPEGVMLEVDYERLVADFEAQARRILAHCGLDWRPECLAFHENKRPVRTASAIQVRVPVYQHAIGRWRVYGRLLQPLFDALGVDPFETNSAVMGGQPGTTAR
jgi:tetratricopeptide (TPR) repeat protein